MYLIELHTGELVHPSSLKNERVVAIVDCIIPGETEINLNVQT